MISYNIFTCRLKKMPQSMPEYALTRNYLELMVELPWSKSTTGERFIYLGWQKPCSEQRSECFA